MTGAAPMTERTAAPMTYSEQTRERAAVILARYPAGRQRSALLPLLHLVQSEDGYVTPRGVAFCAEVLGITKAEVSAVATFYTMYKRRPVPAEHVLVDVHVTDGSDPDRASDSLRSAPKPPPSLVAALLSPGGVALGFAGHICSTS